MSDRGKSSPVMLAMWVSQEEVGFSQEARGKTPLPVEHDEIELRQQFEEHARPETGRYTLELRSTVESGFSLAVTERRMIDLLDSLSQAWLHTTNCPLDIYEWRMDRRRRFRSNREQVVRQLQAREGRLLPGTISVSTSTRIGWGYKAWPLGPSLVLAEAAVADPALRQLLFYFHRAVNDHVLWFVHLFKVGEALKAHLGGRGGMKKSLGIPIREVRRFDRVLNNHDLRHLTPSGAPNLTSSQRRQVIATARSWIKKYIHWRGITISRV